MLQPDREPGLEASSTRWRSASWSMAAGCRGPIVVARGRPRRSTGSDREHHRLQGVEGRGRAIAAGRVGPGGRAVGCKAHPPAGSLLDAVVAAAQGEQVVGRGGSGRPGPHVVEVAEAGCHAAAGEAAPAVAGADQRRELGAGSVGVGREVVVGVEAGAGERVARHERRPYRLASLPLPAVAACARWSRSQSRRTSSGSDGRAPCTCTRSSPWPCGAVRGGSSGLPGPPAAAALVPGERLG